MRSLILTCVCLSTTALGYPIQPQGLWELTQHAELVVIATVEEGPAGTAVPTSFAAAASWTPNSRESVVRLRVRETIKGNPAELVEVRGSVGMLCPAPDIYPLGETVLAFLQGDHGRWRVDALSYGTLYPDDDELPLFKQRILEAVALQSGKFTAKQKTDWAVRAATRRATRWHGLRELPPASTALDDEQRRLLSTGFVAEPSADATTGKLAALLRGHPDPQLDRTLVGAVDCLLEGRDSLAAFDAMYEVILRAGGTRRLFVGINTSAWEHDLGVLRRVWANAREVLHLPEGVKVLTKTPRIRGVGEDTGQ